MMQISYVGHATVRIESGDTTLLTDPVSRRRVGHLRRIVALPASQELRQPDAVLISHGHFDHLDLASLRPLGGCPAIAPRGCARLLRRAGLRDVTEVAPGEQLRVGAVEVTAVLAAHDGRRHPFSRARDTLAYVVSGRERAFFAGDTDLFDGMADVAGDLDVALLPIWGWGPRVGRGHMDPERAARAAALLDPRVVVPIHWGTLASPRAPWRHDPERPARAFVEQVAAHAPAVEVRVLRPGGRTDVTRAAAGASDPE